MEICCWNTSFVRPDQKRLPPAAPSQAPMMLTMPEPEPISWAPSSASETVVPLPFA